MPEHLPPPSHAAACSPGLCRMCAHLVLGDLAQQGTGKEVVPLHGHDQGTAVWGAEQSGNGLQEAHRDARQLGAPLAESRQLLAQGLLQCEGDRAGA